MKKRAYIPILIALLLLPLVSAEIDISDLKDKYNLGDTIELQTYILEQKDMTIIVRNYILCENATQPLYQGQKVLSLKKGIKTPYSASLMIPYGMSGACYIESRVESFNGTVIDSGVSNEFEITKELKGTFVLDKQSVQLGQSIHLTGTIFKLNDVNVDEGIATISFKDVSKATVFADAVEIKDGSLDYTYQLTLIPAGKYSIDLDVSDIYGNQKIFENAASFELFDKYTIAISLEKTQILPGETLRLTGTVRTLDNKLADSADMEIYLDDEKMDLSLANGLFSKDIMLPSTIQSGQHKITINVSDEYGNSGKGIAYFTVIPVATSMANILSSEKFKPSEDLVLTVILEDQAGAPFEAAAQVKILDPKGVEVESMEVTTNKNATFQIPQFAKPGQWTLTSTAKGFTKQTNFLVEESATIEVKLDGNVIVFKNNGNVPYKGSVEIRIGDAKTLTRTLDLDLQGTREINLMGEVENGIYNVVVITQEGETKLGDVEITDTRKPVEKITGKLTGNGADLTKSPLTYIILAAIIIILLYIWFKFKGKKDKDSYTTDQRDKDREEGMKKRQEIKEQRNSKLPKSRFFAKPINQKDAEEFKKSALENIKETEKTIKDNANITKSKNFFKPKTIGSEGYKAPTNNRFEQIKKDDVNPPKGAFSMFD